MARHPLKEVIVARQAGYQNLLIFNLKTSIQEFRLLCLSRLKSAPRFRKMAPKLTK